MATSFHEIWQNILQADGTITASTFSATPKCAGAGSATGNMSATLNGSQYVGTTTLGTQTVSIHVVSGGANPCGN